MIEAAESNSSEPKTKGKVPGVIKSEADKIVNAFKREGLVTERAYDYWIQRGKPIGSPDADNEKAERDITAEVLEKLGRR